MRSVFSGELIRIPKNPTEDEIKSVIDFLSRPGVHHVKYTPNDKYRMFEWREGACVRASAKGGNYLTFTDDESPYGIKAWGAKKFKENYLL